MCLHFRISCPVDSASSGSFFFLFSPSITFKGKSESRMLVFILLWALKCCHLFSLSSLIFFPRCSEKEEEEEERLHAPSRKNSSAAERSRPVPPPRKKIYFEKVNTKGELRWRRVAIFCRDRLSALSFEIEGNWRPFLVSLCPKHA